MIIIKKQSFAQHKVEEKLQSLWGHFPSHLECTRCNFAKTLCVSEPAESQCEHCWWQARNSRTWSAWMMSSFIRSWFLSDCSVYRPLRFSQAGFPHITVRPWQMFLHGMMECVFPSGLKTHLVLWLNYFCLSCQLAPVCLLMVLKSLTRQFTGHTRALQDQLNCKECTRGFNSGMSKLLPGGGGLCSLLIYLIRPAEFEEIILIESNVAVFSLFYWPKKEKPDKKNNLPLLHPLYQVSEPLVAHLSGFTRLETFKYFCRLFMTFRSL